MSEWEWGGESVHLEGGFGVSGVCPVDWCWDVEMKGEERRGDIPGWEGGG